MLKNLEKKNLFGGLIQFNIVYLSLNPFHIQLLYIKEGSRLLGHTVSLLGTDPCHFKIW